MLGFPMAEQGVSTLDIGTVIELLEQVEELPEGGCGALVVGIATATLLAEVGATARWGGHAPSLAWLADLGARGAAFDDESGRRCAGWRRRVRPA
jgi:hypothetical protein